MPAPLGLGPSQQLGRDPLDGPPPSPALAQPPGPLRPGELAPPAEIGSSGLPPEILSGMMDAAGKVMEMLSSFAQVAPDLASEFAAIQASLESVMGKLMVAGAAPTDPTVAGPSFPGGGFDRTRP